MDSNHQIKHQQSVNGLFTTIYYSHRIKNVANMYFSRSHWLWLPILKENYVHNRTI